MIYILLYNHFIWKLYCIVAPIYVSKLVETQIEKTFSNFLAKENVSLYQEIIKSVLSGELCLKEHGFLSSLNEHQ